MVGRFFKLAFGPPPFWKHAPGPPPPAPRPRPPGPGPPAPPPAPALQRSRQLCEDLAAPFPPDTFILTFGFSC